MRLPWQRKHRQIYTFDDNWTPYTTVLDPVALPSFPEYIIPSDFYGLVTIIYNEITTVAGIRSLSPFYTRIYRGSIAISNTGSWNTLKGNTINRYTLSRASLDYVAAANTAGEHYALPPDLYVLPGDRITFYWADDLPGDVWSVCNISFKRWDF